MSELINEVERRIKDLAHEVGHVEPDTGAYVTTDYWEAHMEGMESVLDMIKQYHKDQDACSELSLSLPNKVIDDGIIDRD